MFGVDDLALALGIAALTSGAGVAGAAMNKNKGKSQPGGAQWLQNPQYSFTEPRMELTSDYVTKGIQALSEGKPPTWWQAYEPVERKKRQKSLYEQYYGGGFGPGVLETQQSTDIAAGRRGAGGGSNYAKQLQQYSMGLQDIEDLLTQGGAGAMQTAEQSYIPWSANMPTGPSGQWMTYAGQTTPYQPSALESIAGGVGSMLPYLMAGMGTGGSNQQPYLNPNEMNNWLSNVQGPWGGGTQVTPWGR
jgi:hypothetical protein